MGAAGVVELAAFPLLLLQLPVVMVRVDVTEAMVAIRATTAEARGRSGSRFCTH